MTTSRKKIQQHSLDLFYLQVRTLGSTGNGSIGTLWPRSKITISFCFFPPCWWFTALRMKVTFLVFLSTLYIINRSIYIRKTTAIQIMVCGAKKRFLSEKVNLQPRLCCGEFRFPNFIYLAAYAAISTSASIHSSIPSFIRHCFTNSSAFVTLASPSWLLTAC